MPRAVALNLLASALTILSTIVLICARMIVVEAPVAVPAGSGTGAAARAFYEAINEALRTGDTTAVDRVAAPDFRLHSVSPGIDADLSRLKHHLRTMHEAVPGAQVVIDELTVAGDYALVRFSPAQETTIRFLGLALDSTARVWSGSDVIRATDGRVAEVWGGMEPAPRLTSLGRVQLDAFPDSPRPMMFERFESAGGAAWTSESTHLSRVVYLDVGELTVAVDGHAPTGTVAIAGRGGLPERAVTPGTHAAVGAGEVVRIGPGTRYALRHHAEQTSFRAYAVSFPRERYVGPLRPDKADAAQVDRLVQPLPKPQVLVDIPAAEVPREPLVAAFGRIELPPGTHLSLADAAGPILVHVEEGSLKVVPFQDAARAEDLACDETEAKRLIAGGATLIPMGASAAFVADAAAPLVAVVVVIAPDRSWPGEASR